MKVDFTGLQDAWMKIATYFGSQSVENRIYLVAVGVLLGVALYQLVRNSRLRYYLLLGASGLSLGIGYGVYAGLKQYVLPQFTSLSADNRTVMATIAATLLALLVNFFLVRRIIGARTNRSKRKRADESLVTQTGNFGNTRAGSDDIHWSSDRNILREVLDTYRPEGKTPTTMQVQLEVMKRREVRDRDKAQRR